MVQAILFDFDGTLISLDERFIFPIRDAVLDTLGSIPHEKIDPVFQKLLGSLQESNKMFAVPRFLWKIGRDIGMSRFETMKFLWRSKKNYDNNRYKFSIINGAEQSLKMAMDNFMVAIVTSSTKHEIERAKEHYPFLNEINVIITMDDIKHPKPNKEPVQKAISQLGIPPEDALYVGDLPTDVQAGTKAGVETVAFTGDYGKYTKSLLISSNPDYLVQDHKELQQLLDNKINGHEDLAIYQSRKVE